MSFNRRKPAPTAATPGDKAGEDKYKPRVEPFAGVISSVVAQQRKRAHLGARVNVFIDEKFSFALSADLAFKHGLRPKLPIDAEFLAQLLCEDGETKALTTALNFIGYRPRAEAEIRVRLQRDEWSETVIAAVIQKLRDNKMLDDAQFASDWVESRSRSKPRGARLLKQELRHKGVDKEEIDAALPDADEEIENAIAALGKIERKLEKWEKGRERTQKAIEMMARRGFGYGTVKTALQRMEEADEA